MHAQERGRKDRLLRREVERKGSDSGNKFNICFLKELFNLSPQPVRGRRGFIYG
jgi:hypothetical protein